MKKIITYLGLLLLLCISVNASVCGDNICEGKPRQGIWTAGLENWDNCPQDCGLQTGLRNLAETYHTNLEIYQILDQIMLDNSAYVSKEIIGYSFENNPIYMYKFGNGSTSFMIDSNIHGMEDCGRESAIKYIDWILTNNSEMSEYIKQNSTIYLIPALNPDNIKRQNSRNNYTLVDGSIINVLFGVDLNRNNPHDWGQNSRGSNDPANNSEFKGLFGGSEPEIQALQFALKKYKPTNYVNTHCGGGPYLSTSQNRSVEQVMISKIMNLSGGNNFYINGNSYTTSTRGTAGYEGKFFANSSWIIETVNWGSIPKTIDGYHNYSFGKVLPIFITMSIPLNYMPSAILPPIDNATQNVTQNQTNTTVVLNQTYQFGFTNRTTSNAVHKNVAFNNGNAVYNSSLGSITTFTGSGINMSNTGIAVNASVILYSYNHGYIMHAPNAFLMQSRPKTSTANATFQVGIYSGSSWIPLTDTNFTPQLYVQYNLSFVFENGISKLYVNGELNGMNQTTRNISKLNSLQVYSGNKADKTRGFNGEINNVFVTI